MRDEPMDEESTNEPERRRFLRAALGGALLAGVTGPALAQGAPGAAAPAPALVAPPDSAYPPAVKPSLTYVFEWYIQNGNVGVGRQGKTQYGDRGFAGVIGGLVVGPRIKGRMLRTWGDWTFLRDDGELRLVADYFFETDDGAVIHCFNTGISRNSTPNDQVPYAIHNALFEAPLGKYDWMNRSIFVSVLERSKPGAGAPLKVRCYEVTLSQ